MNTDDPLIKMSKAVQTQIGASIEGSQFAGRGVDRALRAFLYPVCFMNMGRNRHGHGNRKKAKEASAKVKAHATA